MYIIRSPGSLISPCTRSASNRICARFVLDAHLATFHASVAVAGSLSASMPGRGQKAVGPGQAPGTPPASRADVTAAVGATPLSVGATPLSKKKPPRPLPATPSFKAGATEALRAKALRIQQQLAALYPNPPIPLTHSSPFQLLVRRRRGWQEL